MARSQGWTVVISLLAGVVGASAFWLYYPGRLAGQVAADLKDQRLAVEVSPAGEHDLKKLKHQATGPRFQMVADGKQVFLADLKEGRVWRYYHLTKEDGNSREDEGFMSVPLYFAGKKFFTAPESGSQAQAPAAEKSSR
jgi:hypothetical protein